VNDGGVDRNHQIEFCDGGGGVGEIIELAAEVDDLIGKPCVLDLLAPVADL